jgi:hypothetical protein
MLPGVKNNVRFRIPNPNLYRNCRVPDRTNHNNTWYILARLVSPRCTFGTVICAGGGYAYSSRSNR